MLSRSPASRPSKFEEHNKTKRPTTPTPITSTDCDALKKLIRKSPTSPKGHPLLRITTLLKDKLGFARLIDALSANYIGKEIELILGMEATGSSSVRPWLTA